MPLLDCIIAICVEKAHTQLILECSRVPFCFPHFSLYTSITFFPSQPLLFRCKHPSISLAFCIPTASAQAPDQQILNRSHMTLQVSYKVLLLEFKCQKFLIILQLAKYFYLFFIQFLIFDNKKTHFICIKWLQSSCKVK